MNARDRLCEIIETKKEIFTNASDKIWDNPELGYREFKSIAVLIGLLKDNGFKVESNLVGIQTAFKGTYGSGGPVIGFLGEFDALAGLSQEAGLNVKKPLVEGGNGHGCGHNALGVSALAAAIALKEYMEESELSGTIIYYGCPAEETGCGKSFMARDGVFNEIDVAVTWHPNDSNLILGRSYLANIQAEFSFEGVSAHAAAAPQLGRSALDAAELMNVGTNFLREHAVQEARIHYAFLSAGGTSPNVVQNSAKLLYYIRAPKAFQVKELYERIINIAKGAALMTGTTTTWQIKAAMLDLIPNDILGNLAEECWTEVGKCHFSNEAARVADYMKNAVDADYQGEPLSGDVPQYMRSPIAMPASSDVGDVSYIVPVVTIMTQCIISKTPPHSWQLVSQGRTAIMHEGFIHAAKIMALIGERLFENTELVKKAKKELAEVNGGKYDCLIPKNAKAGAIN